MNTQDAPSRRPQKGYSLLELLVVVAIVGVLSLVSVPAFVKYFQGARLKTSLRQLNTDVRGVRQRAVTRGRPTKLSLKTGADQREYRIFDGTTDTPPVWTLVQTSRLDEHVYLHAATFTDIDDPVDGWADVVFRPDGTVSPLTLPTETEGGKPVTKIVMRSDVDLPTNEYRVYFQPTGQLASRGFKF